MKWTVVLLSLLVVAVRGDAVCSEKLLKMELRQDIEDNGMLDCLRVVEAPHSYLETEEEKNKRIAGQWDSDCAFEADYDWLKNLREIHGIQNLVDVSGEIVESDFELQADMCEIIRAAIAAGRMQKVTSDVQGIPMNILDEIDCVGSELQTEICAVNNDSYFKKGSWTILLEALSISINKKTRWTKLEGDAGKSEADSEEDKEMQEKIELAKSNGGPGVDNEEGEEEDRIMMVYQGLDSKYKTDRPPCVDVVTKGKGEPIKGVGITANKIMKMNVLVLANIAGTMKSIKDKKKLGGHLQGLLTVKGKDNKESTFEIGRDQSFGLQTGFVHQIKGKEDLKVEMKLQGDATVECDLESDNNSVMMIGINNQYKSDVKKVEEAFEYPIGDEKDDKKRKKKKEGADSQNGVVKSLTIKKKMDGDGHVLIYYKTGAGIDATVMTQLVVNEEDIKLSRMVNSQQDNKISLQNTGLAIVELKEGENTIDVGYELKAAGKELKQASNEYCHAALHVLELPKDITVEEKTIKEDLNLSAKEWTSIDDMDIDFRNEKPRNVLVVYNMIGQLEEKGQVLHARITLNDKEVVMSRSRSNDYDITKEKQMMIGGSYIAVRGQAIIALKKKSASNKISLEYKVNKGSLTIDKSGGEHETANMQVLLSIPNELKEEDKKK